MYVLGEYIEAIHYTFFVFEQQLKLNVCFSNANFPLIYITLKQYICQYNCVYT